MKQVKIRPVTPTPPQLDPFLTGKELIAYVTNSGHVCTLHRLHKDWQTSPTRYGFVNMAYSDSSYPVYEANTWFEAVRKAATAREVYAFDDYKELISWITSTKPVVKVDYQTAEEEVLFGKVGAHLDPVSSAAFSVRKEVPTASVVAQAEEAFRKATGTFASHLEREYVDWTGAKQVNHTHKSMTALYDKLNELITIHNNLARHVKESLLSIAYGGTPPYTPKEEAPKEQEEPITTNQIKVTRANLLTALHEAIQAQEKYEERLKYTSDSLYLQGLKDIAEAIKDKNITYIELG